MVRMFAVRGTVWTSGGLAGGVGRGRLTGAAGAFGCTRCPEVVDRTVWKEGHRALLMVAVNFWTRLYMSRSCCIRLVIFSTACRTVV